jgi:hypothetical protein
MFPVRITPFLAVLATAAVMTAGPAVADPTVKPATPAAAEVAGEETPVTSSATGEAPGQDAAPSDAPEPEVLPKATEEPRHDGPTTSDIPTQDYADSSAYVLQFTAPTEGGVVPAGDVTWKLQSSAAQYYDITLTCAASESQSDFGYSSYDGELLSGTFLDLPVADSCQAQAYGHSTGETASVSFTTSAPTPEVRNLSASPATFYPYLRDGYRDAASIGFTSRLDSDVVVRVTNSDGRTVWVRELAARSWADYYQRRHVRWSGRNNSGNLVRTGRYRIAVTSDIAGTVRTARTSVVVARGTRIFTVTRTKDGWWDSVDATSGSCYTSNYDPGNHLDCWGGNYARADYRFRVPANARIKSWTVRGEALCCTTGRLTKTGTRTSARSFRVRVKVTGWRGYVVRRVILTYSYRRAI